MKYKGVVAAVAVLLITITIGVSLTRETVPMEEVETISITDSLGRTVMFNKPEKVMILGRGNALTVSAAYLFPEAKEVLTDLPTLYSESRLYQTLDPDIAEKTSVASDVPNIEEIAASEPDMVILKTYLKEDLGDALEQLGINVVYVDFENLDTYVRDIENLGKIFGNEDKASQITEYYETKYNMVLQKTEPISFALNTLFLQYSAKGGTVSFKAPGPDWLQTQMVRTAGGFPLMYELEGNGWNTVSFEQIAEWNPEALIIVTYGDSPTPLEVIDTLESDPVWAEINAVKNHHIYAVPDDCGNVSTLGSWDTPGSRWILCQLWMAKKLQPGLFNDLDLVDEAEMFYGELYGLTDPENFVRQVTGSFP